MDRGCVACAKGKYNLDFLEQCKPCNDTAELGYSEEVLAQNTIVQSPMIDKAVFNMCFKEKIVVEEIKIVVVPE